MATSVEQRYIELHPKSAEQYAMSKDIFPNGVTHDSRRQDPFPFYSNVTHAKGPFKWDLDGQPDHRLQDRPRLDDLGSLPPGHRSPP